MRLILKTLHSTGQKLLAASLKAEREKAGLTQQKLAKKLGRPQSFVSAVESGSRRIDVIEFVTLSDAIGFDPRTLISKIVKKR